MQILNIGRIFVQAGEQRQKRPQMVQGCKGARMQGCKDASDVIE
jgi:hypothetical protein